MSTNVATALVICLSLVACTSGSEGLPGSLTIEGEPPEGALDIEVVEAMLVHELTLGPGSKRPIDVTKMNQRAAQTPKRYDVVAVTTDGVTVASLQAEAMRPIRIPDPGEAITVTYTPAEGEPDAGEITVEIDGGRFAASESPDSFVSLSEHALAYQTQLTWEHTSDSGYAVVVRGARGQLGTGSSKDFTADNEYTLLVPVGGEVAVAVHPDIPDQPSAASVPGIIPGSGTTTLVATD